MDSAVTAYLEAAYQKIRLLKDTAKSQIWLAADRAGQTVILKRLASTDLPLKALQEAACPLCPKILCYAEDRDCTLLVEEHIAGDSLQRLAAHRELTEKEATELLLAVAAGLAILHAHGIVHRDIKPANLLREKSGSFRLIDFDAARLMKDAADEDTALLGTKGYAPPEQYGYGQTDGRSDIYALGMTVTKLLPRGYRGFLSPILRKAASIDPQNRYQSAGELMRAVRLRLFLHQAKLPLLAAIVTAGTLLLLPPFPAIRETQPQETTSSTSPVPETHLPDPPTSNTGEDNPPAQSQPGTSNTPAQPQPETAATPALPSPADSQQLPAPPTASAPAAEPLPLPAPVAPTGTVSSALFWNGQPINEPAHPAPRIAPAEWLSGNAILHIENNSNTIIPASAISLNYKNNYGKAHQSEIPLPALSPGESADLPIPCGPAFPEGAEGLAIWVQIRLPSTLPPQSETYHCLSFDVEQEAYKHLIKDMTQNE